MSCGCGGGHSNPLACYQQDVADILTSLEDSGVLFYAFHKVELQYDTTVNARPFAGDPGQKVSRKVTITPGPMVDTNVRLYQPDGTIIEKTGMAKVKRIVAKDGPNGAGYTQEDLESCSFVLIDGQKWDLVGGSVTRPVNGIFWEMMVQRTKNNS